MPAYIRLCGARNIQVEALQSGLGARQQNQAQVLKMPTIHFKMTKGYNCYPCVYELLPAAPSVVHLQLLLWRRLQPL
jgi:hypothetical protein